LLVVYPARDLDLQVGEWHILQLLLIRLAQMAADCLVQMAARVLELAAHVCSAAGESKANESRFRSSAAGRCGDLVVVLAV
jgi:hypothetical protein